ncbi:MAG TPA: tetratricopeptide repeat protein [Bryobacteraceae bacterium]|nr:tetratricopeptide repeat protein [Bryobacteraceae bacterium]
MQAAGIPVFSGDDVRHELERILATNSFRNAPALAGMLRFVVEQTLEGGAAQLKEYTLGTEIFGRGNRFDPRVDPIVRVQARRLRAKLDQFYAESGTRPPVRISFPRGGYIPTFEGIGPSTLSEEESPEIESVAVLPFLNSTADPRNEVLCDGLTEGLIHALTRFAHLRVVARTSAFAYKARPADARQLGSELGVSHVLEGSLRSAGESLRVTVQLCESRTGYSLWSETCDGLPKRFVDQQDEVVRLVTRRIAKDEAPAAPTVAKLDAYQLYFQGRYHWRQRNSAAIRTALDFFERAKKADRHCALAYAGISDCYMIAGLHGVYPPKWVFPKAKNMAQRAVELDPSLGEAYASLGLVAAAFDWDYEAADAAFRRSLDLNPGYSTAYHWRAVMYLIPHGCFEEAVAHLRLAAQADPLSSVVRADLACALQLAGQRAESLATCEESLEIDPRCLRSHWVKAYILERQGRYAGALEMLERLGGLATDRHEDPLVASSVAMVKSLAGDKAGAEKQLRTLLEVARRRYVSEYSMAVAYLAAGDPDAALYWLKTGCNQRCGGMNWLSMDPRWQPIAGRREFSELISKLNLLSFQPA